MKSKSPTRAMLLALLLPCGSTFAATREVASISDLEAAISAAAPGDVIVVKDGSYVTRESIKIDRKGTEDKPIIIRAETVGGAEISGTHGFNFAEPAAYVCVEGFKLTHASGKSSIGVGTSHCRFSRNTFQCKGTGPYLTVAGDDAEVDRNEFRDKSTVGNMIDVRGTGGQVARRVWIHHNYFHDFASAGGNGAETIRFGLSGLSMSDGNGLVEHNLFERCSGENELISNKSSANTYRYNTLRDSRGQLTVRHGNNCQVYGNYLTKTDGIRFFGDNQKIFGNLLVENDTAIQIGNGGAEVADGAPLTSHDRPDNCEVSFNTLVDNKRNITMSGRTNGLGAVGLVVANNIIQGGGPAAKIDGPLPKAVWRDNIVWKTSGAGDMPSNGSRSVDPKLVPDAQGVYPLPPGTPAVGDAEASKAPVVIRILTPADVGPASGARG